MTDKTYVIPMNSKIHLSYKGKSAILGRIEPTPEDLIITQKNLKRLQRWCREAGYRENGLRALQACRGFIGDMTEFAPQKASERD